MQMALAALIVIAAAGILIYRFWRTARAGTSCSCGSDCHGCDGCPALQAFNAAAPDAGNNDGRPRQNGTARCDDSLPIYQSSS